MLIQNYEHKCFFLGLLDSVQPQEETLMSTLQFGINFFIGCIYQFLLDIRANRGLMHRDLYINTP